MRAGFPHSEILGSKLACQLPEAYRRLQRPSSPVVAKASTSCTCSLDPITLRTDGSRRSTPRRRAADRIFGSTLGGAAADKAATPNTSNAISYPDEFGSEKNRIRFTSSEFLKSSRTMNRKTSGWDIWRLIDEVLVEPTGIEPVTSCLQSRRSPS